MGIAWTFSMQSLQELIGDAETFKIAFSRALEKGNPFLICSLKDSYSIISARKEFAIVKDHDSQNVFLHPYGTNMAYGFLVPVKD